MQLWLYDHWTTVWGPSMRNVLRMWTHHFICQLRWQVEWAGWRGCWSHGFVRLLSSFSIVVEYKYIPITMCVFFFYIISLVLKCVFVQRRAPIQAWGSHVWIQHSNSLLWHRVGHLSSWCSYILIDLTELLFCGGIRSLLGGQLFLFCRTSCTSFHWII